MLTEWDLGYLPAPGDTPDLDMPGAGIVVAQWPSLSDHAHGQVFSIAAQRDLIGQKLEGELSDLLRFSEYLYGFSFSGAGSTSY